MPSNLGSYFVMNWVEALATIDCLVIDLTYPMEEVAKGKESDDSTKNVVETTMEVETIKKMLEVFKDDEAKEEEGNELNHMLHLYYLVDPEPKEGT